MTPHSHRPEPFVRTFHARWGDMDNNGHMRNTAFLDVAGDVRMMFFALHGFAMSEFARLGIGPVIQHDELDYARELRLLESYDVDLTLAGLSEDGARFRMRNTFSKADGKHVATVTSSGGWLDLTARRLLPPPPPLAHAMAAIPRAHDFVHMTGLPAR
ncbi:MAG: thioesterase family protein [Deltaproteobacteria bacterium]|nr:thioesterase family protein [Deltaproteobacteria bacterium]